MTQANHMQRIILIIAALLASCNAADQQEKKAASEEFSAGSGLLQSWPGKGPELLWKYEGLGRGYGGPLVSRDGIFINAEEGGNSYTVCLDRGGTIRWKSPNGKEFTGTGFSASYPGTRSKPSV
jgi:hypothetical protein